MKSGPVLERTVTRKGFVVFFICLAALLSVLFFHSFESGMAHFSNDGPLGPQKATCNDLRNSITGNWYDILWVGFNAGSAPLNLNSALTFLLGPVGFAKFLAPISLLFAGLCGWVFFRQLQLKPAWCALGGLAVALNSNFFSNVCWGLGSRALALGMIFLALALLSKPPKGWGWLRLPLAGLAVGMSILDSADNGAIFSLYVAGYALVVTWAEDGTPSRRIAGGLGRVAVVAAFAFLMAAQGIISIFTTQIAGVKGMEQDQQSAEQRWGWASQWSLPKAEFLRVLIPGLYGYRLDTPDGGQYWGRVGQAPGYEQHHQDPPRHSGAGEYAGVLVVLIAGWAAAQSLATGNKAFTAKEKKLIWYWVGAAIISALLAFGKYAPFYQFLYRLPYFSTIRNPMKFMHPFHLSIMILFGYGLLGLGRRYLEQPGTKSAGLLARFRAWWSGATGFEKKWTFACMGLVALSLVGWMAYFVSRPQVVRYITSPAFDARMAADPAAANRIAMEITRFSLHEVGLYVFVLLVSVLVVTLILCGSFGGRRAKWAYALFGVILVVDLCRANAPWIRYYNYEERYVSNPVIDVLKEKPWEHRVTVLPFDLGYNFSILRQVYNGEWLQHHFPFYNVQCLDMPQESRMPADKAAYLQALDSNVVRLWQLTNTRYLFGLGNGVAEQLNQQFDPAQRRFRVNTFFNFVQVTTPGTISTQTNTNGVFSLIEFAGALPRAKLYGQWQVLTNENAVLQKLPEFNPDQTVLVSQGIPDPVDPAPNTGTVQITSYTPKQVTLESEAAAPTVLLLNNKYDPGWKALVDGKPAQVLKCNFLMQGVPLPPGKHAITMHFEPSAKGLYLTLAAWGIGLAFAGLLVVGEDRGRP